VQSPTASDFGTKYAGGRGFRHVEHNLVVENGCAVEHTTDPEPGVFDGTHEALRVFGGRDVSCDDLDPHPAGVQFRYRLQSLGVGSRTSVHDNDSGTLLSQPAGGDE